MNLLQTASLLAMAVMISCGQPTNPSADAKTASATAPASEPKPIAPAPSAKADDNLDFLKDMAGKYPFDVNLLEHPTLSARLTKLAGEKFTLLKNSWDVQTPIEITDGIFYAWGMQQHSGGDPGGIIMADIPRNILYMGVRDGGVVTTFAEDGGALPNRLAEWAAE